MQEKRNQSVKEELALVKPQINATFEFYLGTNSSLAETFQMGCTDRQIMMYVALNLIWHLFGKELETADVDSQMFPTCL